LGSVREASARTINVLYFGDNHCELNTTLKTGKEEDVAREIDSRDEVLTKLVVIRERRRSEMKRLLLLNIIWLLLISTKVFGQQSTWAEIVLWNYPIDNQDTTVTRGV